MNAASRRILEPRGRVDRFLYAMVAVTGPGIFLSPMWSMEGTVGDIFWPLTIVAFWWVVCAFYTLDALLDGLERWWGRPRGRV